jgi:hypothetical protein
MGYLAHGLVSWHWFCLEQECHPTGYEYQFGLGVRTYGLYTDILLILLRAVYS